MLRIILFTAILGLSLFGGTDALAQFRGGGGDRSGDDGGQGDRGGDRSSRLEGFLRSMDTNGDGIIHEREVPPERARMFRYMAERAGIDTSQGVPISRVVEGMSARRGGPPPQAGAESAQASGASGSTQSGSSSAAPSRSEPDAQEPPLVRGFGFDSQPAAVPGFGTRIQPPSRVVLGGVAEPPASEIDPRMLQYAQSMIARFDRNRSGVLERDEWVQHWGDPGEIDANGDSKITAEELAAHLTRRRQSWAARSSGGGRGSDQQSGSPEDEERSTSVEERARETRAASQRPSYRFPSPHERLPDGLPDWFIERDVNMDGQVIMAEFANDWTDEKVEEFIRYDRDNDGIITVEEALNPLEHPPGTEADWGPTPAAGGQGESPPESEQTPADSGDEKPWWMQ